jgi:hypothetical protein
MDVAMGTAAGMVGWVAMATLRGMAGEEDMG